MQPAPEEEDLTKEGEGEQRWLLHVLYTVLSLRKYVSSEFVCVLDGQYRAAPLFGRCFYLKNT